MKTQIIQIGNSQGIRIPKVLLEDSGLAGESSSKFAKRPLDPALEQGPEKLERNIRSMAENEDDELVDREVPTGFEKEWRW